MTKIDGRGREMFYVLLAFGMICMIVIALMSMTGMIDISDKPIIACDPTKLSKGQPIEEVRGLCGKPRTDYLSSKRDRGCYPLLGEACPNLFEEDRTLIYGNISKEPNVNLYFTAGKLRSVQIYGDWR